MNDLSERLRALPLQEPPPGGWTRLQRRLDTPRRLRRPALAVLSMAASLLLAVGLFFLPALTGRDAGIAPTPQATELAALMQRSRELEFDLNRLRPEVDVWDGNLAARSAQLERGLSVVDLQLNHTQPEARPEQARKLWQSRVDLMSQLVQTHRQATLGYVAYNTDTEHSL